MRIFSPPLQVRTLTIFRGFRQLLDGLNAIASQLAALTTSQRELIEIQREIGPALDRVDALELSRHQFQAEIEGILLRAEGKLKAASNAEARERQLKKSYEKQLLDPFDGDGEQGEQGARTQEEALRHLDAAASETGEVHPVHLDLAPNNKADALRAKWGR